MKRIAIVWSTSLVLALCVASCGGSAGTKSNPSIDFDGSDYSSLDATSPDESTPPNDQTSKDSLHPDADHDTADALADASDTADTQLPDQSDSELPPTCEPGTKYCDGLEIKRCNPDGLGYTWVKTCVDENPCTEDSCEEGKCIHDTPDGACCFPACEIGQICMGGECRCASMCVGKECGDDGCGGTCGECPAHNVCTPDGQCSCIPQCEGKQCGDDDCGSECGTCPDGNICQDGQCICIPNCDGKICGSDGCGGSCGPCAPLEECIDNACTFTCSACPQLEGCSRFLLPTNYHAYYLCPGPKDWEGAKDFCEERGTYLVNIGNAEENSFLATILAGSPSVWIGLSQDWGDWGKWKWTNGNEPDYKAWGSDQPDDGGLFSSEDCVETNSAGAWNDDQCSSEQGFICELAP